MNGARKGLFALGASLLIGGSMIAPLGTASAQTRSPCETFMYNWCLNHWDDGGPAGVPWTSPASCYEEMVATQCSSSGGGQDPGPYYPNGDNVNYCSGRLTCPR